MVEVASVRFQLMASELQARMVGVLEEFAEQSGQQLNLEAMTSAHERLGEIAHETLMFGMGVVSSEDDEENDRAARNVVLFPVQRERRLKNSMGFARMALSTVGALAFSSILAAATTPDFNLPGMSYVAEVIYRNNMPAETVHYVEHKGVYLKIVARRVAGEPVNILHVADISETNGTTDEGEVLPAVVDSAHERVKTPSPLSRSIASN